MSGAGEPGGRLWVLEFAGLPPNVNERSRMHHMARAREVKQWRRYAEVVARCERVPPLGRARISATIWRPRLGVADESGDAERLKPLIDGIVDAGVLPDDTREYVEWGQVGEERGVHGIWLVIEELEPVGPRRQLRAALRRRASAGRASRRLA